MHVKTTPGVQWRLQRELRERFKTRFDDEGIEIPFPQRAVWIRSEA
jgi:small conductance mechanosensitive channel